MRVSRTSRGNSDIRFTLHERHICSLLSVLHPRLLINRAYLLLGDFWHRLRCVRGVTRNAAGRETGNDDECHDESWYKTHHYSPIVLTLYVSRTTIHGSRGNATR